MNSIPDTLSAPYAISITRGTGDFSSDCDCHGITMGKNETDEHKGIEFPKDKTDFSTSKELSDQEKKQVEELEKADREVRAHEQAHIAAAGGYARGGASYTYSVGPDGKRYAVGGEVSIDTSEVSGNPQATIRKMQVVRKAAMAPASPSSTDRAVAAEASQKISNAQQELLKERTQETESEPKVSTCDSGQCASYSKDGFPADSSSRQSSGFLDVSV